MRFVSAMILGACVAFSAPACSSLAKNQTEILRDEVSRFNENVRWGRYRAAATQLPTQHREVWVESMERAGRSFRILEYEVRPQSITDDTAVVVVDVTYHVNHDVVIQRMRRRQVWKKDGDWFLDAEHEIAFEPEPEPTKFPEFGKPAQSANSQ